jgi:ketosteroid isomerase-like protein
VIEILWEGTHQGPLQAATGDTIAATGKAIKVPAVQIVKVSGDRITEIRHYFDLLTLMAQLGVVPVGTPG